MSECTKELARRLCHFAIAWLLSGFENFTFSVQEEAGYTCCCAGERSL